MGIYNFIWDGMELQRIVRGMRRDILIERNGRPFRRDDSKPSLTWQNGRVVLRADFKDGIAVEVGVELAEEAHKSVPIKPGHVDGFGCATCMSRELGPNGPQEGVLEFTRQLIDTSHYAVLLAKCATCGQDFLYFFTEMIDWEDGDDDQNWVIVPLTEAESAALQLAAVDDLGGTINGMTLSRPHIAMSSPKGGTKLLGWRDGHVILMPHD